ncbi:hypothetical protein ACLI4Q_06570 [Natrialbaceae archaeon A-CW1-1]
MSTALPDTHLETRSLLGAQVRDYWLEAIACVLPIAAFTLTGGPVGFFMGVVTVAVWVTLGTPYALAVGHVGIVLTFTAGVDPITLIAIEVGFVALLISPLIRARIRLRSAAVSIAVVAGGVGLVWLTLEAASLWLVAAVTVGFLAVVSYAIHRLELVTLGLVTDSVSDHDGNGAVAVSDDDSTTRSDQT